MVNGNVFFDSTDELNMIQSKVDRDIIFTKTEINNRINNVEQKFNSDIEKINKELDAVKFDIEFLTWKSELSCFKRYLTKFGKFTKEKYMWGIAFKK